MTRSPTPIRLARERAGLTLAQAARIIAARTGVPLKPDSLRRYENGIRPFPPYVLEVVWGPQGLYRHAGPWTDWLDGHLRAARGLTPQPTGGGGNRAKRAGTPAKASRRRPLGVRP